MRGGSDSLFMAMCACFIVNRLFCRYAREVEKRKREGKEADTEKETDTETKKEKDAKA